MQRTVSYDSFGDDSGLSLSWLVTLWIDRDFDEFQASGNMVSKVHALPQAWNEDPGVGQDSHGFWGRIAQYF
jgi:hypothetical protein